MRLHTHLAETRDEEDFCLERYGVRPLQYLDDLGWLGDDVWLAHCVHLDGAEVGRMGATGTGVAHCPTSNARLGAGIAPVRDLLDAGAPVGLGVDGAASNESGELTDDLRGALLVGPAARRAAGAHRARGARARHPPRRALPRPRGRARPPRASARSPTSRCGASTTPATPASPTPSRRSCSGRRAPCTRCSCTARSWCEDGELRTADPAVLAADLARESAPAGGAGGSVTIPAATRAVRGGVGERAAAAATGARR